MKVSSVDLTAEQEQSTAHRIIALEDELRAALASVPQCRDLLAAGARVGRTRHAAMDKLALAYAVVRDGPDVDPALQLRATLAWDAAQALRWQLAMSATAVARREAHRIHSHRVPMDDLLQDSLLGLFGAAQRFEPGLGVRFRAYARWWVRAQLTQSNQMAGIFRISASSLELHRNLCKLVSSDERAGVRRTLADLATELGVKTRRLREAMAAGALRPAEEVDDTASSVVNDLPDLDQRSPEDAAVAADVAHRLREAIDGSFVGRDRFIVQGRHGIDTEALSVAAMAQTLKLSTERVRQLDAQCLAVLRDQFAREVVV